MEIDVKSLVLWIIIAVLITAVICVLFINGSHHTVVSAGQTASSGMVGGC